MKKHKSIRSAHAAIYQSFKTSTLHYHTHHVWLLSRQHFYYIT